ILADHLTAGQHPDVLEHRLAAITEAGRLHRGAQDDIDRMEAAAARLYEGRSIGTIERWRNPDTKTSILCRGSNQTWRARPVVDQGSRPCSGRDRVKAGAIMMTAGLRAIVGGRSSMAGESMSEKVVNGGPAATRTGKWPRPGTDPGAPRRPFAAA